MSMIDAAHAVFPGHAPCRLSFHGAKGSAVFRDVDPVHINPTFSVQRFGQDLELVSGELDGVHFEGVGKLVATSGRFESLSLRMLESKAAQ